MQHLHYSSMHQRVCTIKWMKRSRVVLFHETLKSLNIKHEILAFNEDAFEADERQQPNIIDEIINYNYSIFEKEGPRIMTLEPQDDIVSYQNCERAFITKKS